MFPFLLFFFVVLLFCFCVFFGGGEGAGYIFLEATTHSVLKHQNSYF